MLYFRQEVTGLSHSEIFKVSLLQCLLQYILFYSITVSKELNVNYIATIYKDNITGKQAKRTREEVKREVRQMPLNLESKPKSLKCCLSCLPQRSESDIVSTLNKD